MCFALDLDLGLDVFDLGLDLGLDLDVFVLDLPQC